VYFVLFREEADREEDRSLWRREQSRALCQGLTPDEVGAPTTDDSDIL
jgi:hypothetical protein